ncbi:MAG: DPP IV N-terminal domain-containing protein [Candidatus Aminicenantes bacterium]|jgi:Tol biopolymer transport system component
MKKKSVFILICLYSALLVFCQPHNDSQVAEQVAGNFEDYMPEIEFEGKIVFQSDMDGDYEIYLLTKNGLAKLTDNDWNDENPKWSPDGTKIGFTANPDGKYEMFVMDSNGQNVVQLTTDLRNPIGHAGHNWHPDGKRIAYTVERRRGFRKSHNMKIVDIQSKKMVALAPQLKGKAAIPDFAPSEPLLGITAKRTIGWEVAVFDLRTKELSILTEGGDSCRPHFSWDGKRIAYVSSEADGKGDIWLMNPDGSDKSRLTQRDEHHDYFPAWSPDDRFVVFSSTLKYNKKLKGDWGLYLVRVDNKEITLLLDTPGGDLFPDWYR